MTYFELASNLRLSCNWIETDLERTCVCFCATWNRLGVNLELATPQNPS